MTDAPAQNDSAASAQSEATASAVQLRPLHWMDPLRWVARGVNDMVNAPGISSFYGVCFWILALALGWVFRAKPEYAMSIASGCLLVGPFLAMGLYDTSRRREAGLPPDLGQSITCWDTHMGSMGMLVLVLIVLELLWGRASLVVFAVFFHTGLPSTTGVVRAIFNPENWEFVLAYLSVGSVFATLVFSSMVVSIPMILDRDTDALTAGITSIRVVLQNPGVMLLWGIIISVLVGLSLWSWGAGLLVVGPVLGYASWHAYRAAIEPQSVAPACADEVAQADAPSNANAVDSTQRR